MTDMQVHANNYLADTRKEKRKLKNFMDLTPFLLNHLPKLLR